MKKKNRLKNFKRNITLKTSSSINKVLNVIEQIKQLYPNISNKIKIEDIQITQTMGKNDQKITVKYSFTDKPQKGIQSIQVDNFQLENIIQKYLNKK